MGKRTGREGRMGGKKKVARVQGGDRGGQEGQTGRLLKRQELCLWLQLSEREVARLVADDASRFPVLRIGRQLRFDQAEVKEWMRASAGRHLTTSEQSAKTGRPAIQLPEYLQMIADGAPEEYRMLVCRLDKLVHDVAAERGAQVDPGQQGKLKRLAYTTPLPFRNSETSSFAMIDTLGKRPRKGARVRVLFPVASRGEEWEPPAGWQKAGSGYWIVTNVTPRSPLTEVRTRIGESLDYVTRRSAGTERGE